MGLPSDNIMPVWHLRNVLLSADQLCLSRMQIHVILSIVHPDEHGDVEFGYFLRVCGWPELKLFGGEVFYVRHVNWVRNTTPTAKARDLGWKISTAMGGLIEG